jgi:hypothetical protein
VKKVLALRGTANAGKSTTIRSVYQFLRRKHPDLKIEGDIIKRVEIKAVLTINGIRIGIESQGDPGGRLAESLVQFEALGCALIICATRTFGRTTKAVERLRPKYEVTWIDMNRRDEILEQETRNQKAARQIIAEIEQMLSLSVKGKSASAG